MRLQVLATLAEVCEWRWLKACMPGVTGQLLSALGYRYGQPYPPDVAELLAAIEEFPLA
jgi:hypothetical protein